MRRARGRGDGKWWSARRGEKAQEEAPHSPSAGRETRAGGVGIRGGGGDAPRLRFRLPARAGKEPQLAQMRSDRAPMDRAETLNGRETSDAGPRQVGTGGKGNSATVGQKVDLVGQKVDLL